ncbi:MAG: heme exporter protein CcmB [Anaerolineales bacterium]|nr:heme exporter protein CcmB [Anaerolineales bacterium]
MTDGKTTIFPESGGLYPPSCWKILAAIFWKDLAIELRRRQLLASLLIFSVLILFIFHFSLELRIQLREELFSGILWAAVFFSGAIGFEYTMSIEDRAGAMDGLRLAPIHRGWIYLGKLVANLFFLLLTELLLLPVCAVLFGVNLFHTGFLLVLLLGTIGYTAAGTLFTVMSARTRTRELLLPLLLFPVVLPLLLPAVQAGTALLAGESMETVQSWINVLLGYDILLLTTILLLFDAVVEE